MKAREWLLRGQTSEDPFDAFSNYWRGFNNLFAGKGRERDLISAFLSRNLTQEYAQELLDSFPTEIDFLMADPVIDMRNNNRDTSNYILNFNQSETAIEKLIALFMVIYQVRCNFEHGQKSPSRGRDQNLCLFSGPIIAKIVEKYA